MKKKVTPTKNKRKTSIYGIFKRKLTRILKAIFLLLFLACIGLIFIYYLNRNDNIKMNTSQITLYINSADNVSTGRLQVNWKYLAAIDWVRNDKDFLKSNDKNVNELGQLFLEKTGKENKYTLLSLDTTLNNLSFSSSQKRKTYKYIKQLELIGLSPDNLKVDSSYRRFIDDLSPKAIEVYNKFGILPSITISQAILESNWGKSKLSVASNNLFGIKADSNWTGKSVKLTTSENYNDVIKASFRSYDNKTDSLDDYGAFMLSNKRYKENGVFTATLYIAQAQAIENAGYSTKEDKSGNKIYADLLINVIKENDLQLLDNKVQGQK